MTSRPLAIPLALLLATATLPGLATAQRQIASYLGTAPGAAFGAAIAAAPDRHNDGPDLVIGSPEADFPFVSAGKASWLNGTSAVHLSTVVGSAQGMRLGTVVAACADLNGDSVPDYIAAAPASSQMGTNAGYATAVNGATGSLLWQVHGAAGSQFGMAICVLPDLNGDGRPDVAVGAPGGFNGHVYILSGSNGHLIRSYQGSQSSRFGVSLAAIRSAAGQVRLLVGEERWGTTNGRVLLLDPMQSAAFAGIWAVTGAPGDFLGRIVAAAGDLDGDGHDDVLAGRGNGHVDVFSGALGAWQHTLHGNGIPEYGAAIAGIGDIDLDGRPDIAIGAPGAYADHGVVFVYSGTTYGLMFGLLGTPGSRSGTAIAGIGDLDGDGRPDFAVGAPFYIAPGLGDVGRVTVHGYTVAAQANPFGAGCPVPGGSTPILEHVTLPRLGAAFDLKVRNAPGNTLTLWLHGLSATQHGSLPLPAPLAFLGAPGCHLYTSIDATAATTTNPSGASILTIAVPAAPQLAGFRWFVQSALLVPAANPLGAVTTRGIELIVGHP
jgi:hypothetical protein